MYNELDRSLDKSVSKISFSYFITKTYIVGTQKNLLNEMVLSNTQNKCLIVRIAFGHFLQLVMVSFAHRL